MLNTRGSEPFPVRRQAPARSQGSQMREMRPALRCANTFMVSLMDILLYSPVSVPLTAILERTMCDHYDT